MHGPKVILDSSGKMVARLHGRVIELAPGYRLVRYRTAAPHNIKPEILPMQGFGWTDWSDSAMNPLSQVLLPQVKRSDYAVNPLSDMDYRQMTAAQAVAPRKRMPGWWARNHTASIAWKERKAHGLSDSVF